MDFVLFMGLIQKVPQEAALKNKVVRKVDMFQEINLEGAGPGRPCVLKEKPVGRRTGLAG